MVVEQIVYDIRSGVGQIAGREAMQRVAIIGNAGGGKSTLARTVGARYGLPVYIVRIVKMEGARLHDHE
jgi:MoxR-like ATPase